MVIGRCNGAVLVEEGKRVLLVQQPGEHLATAQFVTVLATIVLAANGAFQLLVNPLAGVGFLAGAAALGAAAVHVKRRLSARASSPVREAPRLVFDFGAGTLQRGDGVVLAPLHELTLERCVQVASSSRALRLRWPNDSVIIARGNPFGDHVGELEAPLQRRGVRVMS